MFVSISQGLFWQLSRQPAPLVLGFLLLAALLLLGLAGHRT